MSTMAAVGYLGSAAAYRLVKTGWVRYEGKRHDTLSIFFKVPNNKKRAPDEMGCYNCDVFGIS